MVSVFDCLQRINAALQLLGQLDNTGAPPATTDAIKTLPVVTITQEHVGKLAANFLKGRYTKDMMIKKF